MTFNKISLEYHWYDAYDVYGTSAAVRWWLNAAPRVLRTMFGSAVRYVDWSDFVVRCLDLPFPSADHLSDLERQYTALELDRAQTEPCRNGIVVKGKIIIEFGTRRDTCRR